MNTEGFLVSLECMSIYEAALRRIIDSTDDPKQVAQSALDRVRDKAIEFEKNRLTDRLGCEE